jgi:Zn finger protein HypA/HybF involved in hydrogenase expression
MNPVDATRTRECIRCKRRFSEPDGTVTRICDDCRDRSAAVYDGLVDGTVVNRHRTRTCIRCSAGFTERPGEISRLCPACDSDHVSLE